MGEIIRTMKNGRFLGWYLRYIDADGKRKHRASRQPSKELARRMLVEIEARINRGLAGMIEPVPPSPTVAELIERFLLEYSRPRIKNMATYRSDARTCLRRLLPSIGECRVDALKAAELARVRDALSIKYSAASVRVSLGFLGSVFSWGVKQEIIPRNPLLGVERPISQPCVDYFSRDEVVALLRLAAERADGGRRTDKLLFCLVYMAVHTGLRKGELLGLRWQDLDFDTRRLTVARSYKTTPKSGRARHLRLPSNSVPILREWKPLCPPTPDSVVFPVPQGGSHSHKAMLGLPKLLEATGCRVPAHPWHVLRHTFASHFIMQGGNLVALQKILGHSDIRLTMIYAHLEPNFLAAEMDRVVF